MRSRKERKNLAMEEKKIEHTPAPWKVSNFKRGKLGDNLDSMPNQFCVQSDFHATGKLKNGPEATICEIPLYQTAACVNGGFMHRISDSEQQANAKLIAAAPELLLACQSILEWYELDVEPSTQTFARFDLVKAAVTKATGK